MIWSTTPAPGSSRTSLGGLLRTPATVAALLALSALAGCDGRYAHARCMRTAEVDACSACCVEEGFSDEVLFEPDDRFVEADCWCFPEDED